MLRALVLGLGLLAACSGSDGSAASSPPREAERPSHEVSAPAEGPHHEQSEPVAATARPASEADPAAACDRARVCCEAFVSAIGDETEAERARVACEQMENVADLGSAAAAACEAAIEGWRRALELADRRVPTACR